MNAADVLKYGHRTFLKTLDGLPEAEWEKTGVCGWWSVKNIIAHLASYELVLVDVLSNFLDGGLTPYLDKYLRADFNDSQVAMRKDQTPAETLTELNEVHAKVMSLIVKIPPEKLCQPGTLPWYGLEYSLDDFIVYAYYGHKREHSAQVNVFRDTLKKGSPDLDGIIRE
ncbi:MAG TPA: DinB family protein [Anaerolineae bacterium]|nr:DinB family protein [Anaerolineae bacterium]